MSIFNANHQSNGAERRVSPEVQQHQFAHYAVTGEFRAEMDNLVMRLNLLNETLAAPQPYAAAYPEKQDVQPTAPNPQTTHAAQVADLEQHRHEDYIRNLVEEAHREAA